MTGDLNEVVVRFIYIAAPFVFAAIIVLVVVIARSV